MNSEFDYDNDDKIIDFNQHDEYNIDTIYQLYPTIFLKISNFDTCDKKQLINYEKMNLS